MQINNRRISKLLFTGIFLLTLWQTCLTQAGHAQDAVTKAAVVRLSSSASAKCGTGFFIEDGRTIVINAHLAKSLCSRGKCKGIAISSDSAKETIQTEPPLKDLTVRAIFPAIDITLLELPSGERNPTALKFGVAAPRYGENITMIGFPGCANLTVTTGNIYDLNNIWFNSGAQGTGGSSGSPILNSEGQVIGVGFQVDSFVSLFTDTWGSQNYNIRAIRGDVIQSLRAVSLGERIKSEAELLLEFYSQAVMPSSGLARLHRGLFFLNAARSLANSIAGETGNIELLRAATLIDRWPDSLWHTAYPAPSSQQGKIIERLAFAANVEARGPIDHSLRRLDDSEVSEALQATGRGADEIQRFLELLPSPGAKQIPGTLPTLLFTTALIAAAIIAILVLWSWSLGYTYARASGGRIRRIATTLFIAVALWPLSFLVFRFFYRRGKSSRA